MEHDIMTDGRQRAVRVLKTIVVGLGVAGAGVLMLIEAASMEGPLSALGLIDLSVYVSVLALGMYYVLTTGCSRDDPRIGDVAAPTSTAPGHGNMAADRDEAVLSAMSRHALRAERGVQDGTYLCPECEMLFNLSGAQPVEEYVVLCPFCGVRLYVEK